MMHEPVLDSTDRPRPHPEPVTFNGEPLRVMQVMAGARGRRHQTEYTEAACVARYLQLFQRLLAERAGGERADAR